MKLFSVMLAGSAMMMLAACDKGPGEAKNQSVEDVASEMKKISLQPGEWESTQEVVDVKFEGGKEAAPPALIEAMKGQKQTSKSCITPEQAANPSADFLTAQKDSNCTYSGFEMAGGKIQGKISCPAPQGQQGKADVTIDGTYSETAYAMNMEMQAAGMGGPAAGDMKMHMVMKTSGKRIGDCPATPAAK
ncbi:MAG: DUF3617 domain-containing protein [Sphingobium sp.]|nr:DUF3617 domain-containing protein [Sphingobium sp.]